MMGLDGLFQGDLRWRIYGIIPSHISALIDPPDWFIGVRFASELSYGTNSVPFIRINHSVSEEYLYLITYHIAKKDTF